MDIATANQSGNLGQLIQVEIKIDAEGDRVVACAYSNTVDDEVTELQFFLDEDTDVSEHDLLVAQVHANAFGSVKE